MPIPPYPCSVLSGGVKPAEQGNLPVYAPSFSVSLIPIRYCMRIEQG